MTDFDTCPIDGAPTVEPDGIHTFVLHCSHCAWELGIQFIGFTLTNTTEREC